MLSLLALGIVPVGKSINTNVNGNIGRAWKKSAGKTGTDKIRTIDFAIYKSIPAVYLQTETYVV